MPATHLPINWRQLVVPVDDSPCGSSIQWHGKLTKMIIPPVNHMWLANAIIIDFLSSDKSCAPSPRPGLSCSQPGKSTSRDRKRFEIMRFDLDGDLLRSRSS